MGLTAFSFDPDFASPGDWAAMYRAAGIQTVPANMPRDTNWKFPIIEWETFQNELVPDSLFARWYGQHGEHARRLNMGMLTGRCSRNIFIIDIDSYKTPLALAWWRSVMAEHNNDMELETCEQITGGGGRQLLYEAPPEWETPTNRTTIKIDIRGQGGFAMLPPSLHDSGNNYAWKEGHAPWEMEIAKAPDWLLQAVDKLVMDFSGKEGRASSGPHKRTESPESDFNAFGQREDGREDYMTRLVWGAVTNWYRECPIPPQREAVKQKMAEVWDIYERKVKTRLQGVSNADGLEREGRGYSLFRDKFERAIFKWDEDVAEAAKASRASETEPPPKADQPHAKQDSKIKTTDFMTLYSEDVIEEPDYIEPGFAGPGNFVLIAGPPKAQKSFLLQEMLVAAATGTSFLVNTFQCPRPLRIFYLQAEMNRKLLRKRVREFKLLTGAEKQLLSTNLIISERFHMILNDGGVKTAVETIQAAFPNEPPDIIAVDPLANVFDQENENDNAQLMRFLTGRIEAIRQQINPSACVVMVHHATKKSSEEMAKDPFVAIRGAGALRGYYDSAIVIFRASEESKTRKLHFELRSGESPEPLQLELDGGRFRSVTETSSITKDTARLILQEIEAAWLRNVPWSPHERAKTEGRYAVYNASKQFNVNAKAVQALINEWLRNGIVAFRERVQGKRTSGLQVTGSID